ncbi:hypothetical protein [Mariniphaga sp.]|uniref:hypothetical protein n=1 Tax=Mariniphaga sp. TaxID=1954475 RepID=UPI003566F080
MKAIELNSRTDKKGYLKIKYPLEKSEKNVRILILVDEDNNETEEEELWLKAISQNPAFDFLKDESEDIYSLNDGEPFND